MNDIQKTIETLESFNRWRRDEGETEHPGVREIDIAIDDACDYMNQLNQLKEELTKAVNECIKLTKVINEMNKNKTLQKGEMK